MAIASHRPEAGRKRFFGFTDKGLFSGVHQCPKPTGLLFDNFIMVEKLIPLPSLIVSRDKG